ncbi:MAG: hypothetical protein J6M17_02290 [Ruminococcus sp.]|nr:hypothetical protein [Ruminococcus sp.]
MKLMKYIKKATALSAAAAISVTAAISASAAEDANFFNKGAQKDANGNKPGFVDLDAYGSYSAGMKSAYNDLYTKCVDIWNSSENIAPTTVSGDSVYIIATYDLADFGVNVTDYSQMYEGFARGYQFLQNFMADNPLFYFVDGYGADVLRTTDGKYSFAVTVSAEYASGSARQEIQTKIKDFYGQAESKVAGLDTLAKKHQALYQYLLDNMTYAYEKNADGSYKTQGGHKIPSDAPFAHNIVGPAVNKEGVCESYGRSYELLCNFAGLDCIFSLGQALNADNQGRAGGHAWDYIKLDDGKYYGLDGTWDDQITEAGREEFSDTDFALNFQDTYSRNYFGIGTSQFFLEHGDATHSTQTAWGESRSLPDGTSTPYYGSINMVLYEIDQIAGVVRPTYDYYVPGDVNCDLDFDMRDLIRLGKYTVNPSNVLIAKGAANGDGQGAINMADAVYLQKSLLGYENNEAKVDVTNYPTRK